MLSSNRISSFFSCCLLNAMQITTEMGHTVPELTGDSLEVLVFFFSPLMHFRNNEVQSS